MKQKSLLRSMLLLFALIVGSSSVWAANADVTYDFTGTDWSVNNSNTLTNGTVSFTGAGAGNKASFKMNSGYFMLGKQGAYLNFPTYSSAVEKIVITGNSNASASTKMNIFVGNTAVSTETTGSTGTNTYNIASGCQTAGTQYTLKVTSDHNAQITKIEIFYASSTPSTEWTVTYNANGADSGSVPTDENTYSASINTVTVLGNTGSLAKTGYTFGGWNTKADGTGTNYTAGNTFTISASTTLYAKWNANTHTVTLPTNDSYGTYTMSATNPVAYGTEVTLTYTPATGYENYQATWSVNGTAISGNKFTMPDADVTITVSVAEVVDYAELPFNWAGGASADFKKLDGVTLYGNGSDYSSNDHSPYLIKFDGDGDYILVKTDSQPGKVSVGVKMIGGATSSSITVQGSSDGSTFTNVETLTISGAQNSTHSLETSKSFAATDRYVRLYFNKGSNVGVGPISIAKPTNDPVINADATLDLAADDTSGEIAYTISNPVDGTSLTASVEEGCNWISDVTVASDKVTFTTTANTSAERSAVITLTYGSLTKDVTVTQADGTPVTTTTYTLATEFVPGRHYIIVGYYNNVYKAMGEQGTSNRAAVGITVTNGATTIASNAGVSEVLLGVDGSGFFTFYDEENNGYLYASCGTGTNNTMNVQSTLDDYGRWTIKTDDNGALIVLAQDGKKNQLQYNNGNSIFSCYSGTQKDIYLFERDGDTGSQNFTTTIDARCNDGKGKYYGTYSAPFAFTVPSDVTVSEISVIDGQLYVEDYEVGDIIPANTGVMISSTTAGSKTFTSAKGGESVLDDYNNLRPTYWGIGATEMVEEGSNWYYRLTMHGADFQNNIPGTIGFWWGAENGGAFNYPTGYRAYLVVPQSQAPVMGFGFDDETTNIQNIERTINDNQYYTLDGRRVAQPTKGLYIINGKKVVVK